MTPIQEAQATDLMRRAQRGEEEPYAELLVLLAAAARTYVRSRVLTPVSWLDDAVQETLIAVHHARHTYDSNRPFAPWFYAIARNRFIGVLRREQRVRRHEIASDAYPELWRATNDDTSGVDMEEVKRALSSLPPRQREVVEAMKLRDESVRDIAARLGMTMAAVKVTAHRGYRALRCQLGVDLREE